jgi:diguanylate cyclase (GGDEF)-like protein
MNRRSAPTRDAQELARVRRELVQARQELERLYAALDNVDSGVLLLNDELRALYSNRSLHVMFKSLDPEVIRRDRPLYVEMLKQAAAASAVDIEDYVERRIAWVQSGDPRPMDLNMADGTVLRCHSTVLPGGGRMLIYSDVTDIVRSAQELERLATTDGMTGIYNRRHFLTLADREWSRARRYGRAISLLMIDIDFFKLVNDTFGHNMGDEMIVHMTNLVRARERKSDVLARIGGDEFALLLPETDLPQAHALAERLRGEVAANPLMAASHSVLATISIGAAAANDTMSDFSQLMKAADQALYDAKRAGRNQVMCSAYAEAVSNLAEQGRA